MSSLRKGKKVQVFIPHSDYDAWVGMAKKEGLQLNKFLYKCAAVTLREILEQDKFIPPEPKEVTDVAPAST